MPLAESSSARAAPATAATATTTVVEEEDDDALPQPGRVWDSGGPSLAEMMKKPVMASVEAPSAAPAAATDQSNIEQVDPSDISGLWGSLLALLSKEEKHSLQSVAAQGQLVGVDEHQATIRYSAANQTFYNMLSRNGKKELIAEAISRLIGRPVGVKLELSAAAVAEAAPVAVVTKPLPPRAQPAAPQREVEAMPSQAPAARPTPEQIREAENNPLVKALMQKFDATIVRITED